MNDKEYWEQGKERLEEYAKSVDAIIEMQPEPRRKQLKRLFDGPLGEQFMLSPASTRRAYHNAFPHGLVDHTLRVVKNTLKIAEALWPGRWSKAKLACVALLHDFGKVGTPGHPFYVQTKEQWKERKGEFWDIEQEVWAPNAEMAIWTLLKAGVDLEYDEIQAIRLNDGMGPAENKPYSFHEDDLALVVHWADHAAMRMEKELDR